MRGVGWILGAERVRRAGARERTEWAGSFQREQKGGCAWNHGTERRTGRRRSRHVPWRVSRAPAGERPRSRQAVRRSAGARRDAGELRSTALCALGPQAFKSDSAQVRGACAQTTVNLRLDRQRLHGF